MAEKKAVLESGEKAELMIAKAKDFWERNSKLVSIVFTVLVLGVGGYFIYKNYIQKPKEEKATDAMFKAEEYYRKDSTNLALKGDGQYLGFLKIIDRYSGTEAGNLACFYAGVCYLKLDDNQNAVKYLKKFSTSSRPVKARVYKLLADASGDLGKYADALDYYKKSASTFADDKENSAEALLLAAYLADKVMKNQKEAIELYKELIEKYPATTQKTDAENYLAQLGVYNAD
ncbi:MAG TPA: tetratricopeptide repeat protein [Chitinophagaceae bacterium]|nr:tetratricopeptide repeat protein [Chitinophagaceae bacterium]